MQKIKTLNSKILVGWSEWCGLPNFDISRIKAKIDTGAQTSALHAFNIQPFTKKGMQYVKFDIHPIQRNDTYVKKVTAQLIDERYITSSNGQRELRFVVNTILDLGGLQWPIELTLSNRDSMQFRFLLGREALNHRVIIDPAKRLVQSKP